MIHNGIDTFKTCNCCGPYGQINSTNSHQQYSCINCSQDSYKSWELESFVGFFAMLKYEKIY